ncbi:hypothetical protein P7C71_g2436, partial [Lecanoromycetidae sp. Uapishka_2]
MSWTVPLSSSPQPPSTPGSGQRSINFFTKSPNGIPSNPSTTPAGPPPSSVRSFTPADPPPSSIFGSSQLSSGKTLFKKKSSATSSNGLRGDINPFSKSIDEDKLARYLNKTGQFDLGSSNGAPTKNTFGLPVSSPQGGSASDSEEASYDEDSEGLPEIDDDPESEEYEGNMDVDTRIETSMPDLGSTMKSALNGSLANGNTGLGSSILNGNPRGVKRSRGGAMLPSTYFRSPKKSSKSKQDSAVPAIAKHMATKFGVAELEESDEFIVRTEEIIQRDLYGLETPDKGREQARTSGLPQTSESLSRLWRSAHDQYVASIQSENDMIIGIGPNEEEPSLQKAIFVGALLLQLRHPPEARGMQALAVARLNRSSTYSRSSEHVVVPPNPTALPKVLIDWLDIHHNPYHSAVTEVLKNQPNPTAHHNYWDVVSSLTLRGKLGDVALLLKRSNFQHARTAKEDSQGSDGYQGLQIRNIDRVISRAIQALETCPALQDDNWNVTGNEWMIYRKRIEQAVDDLAVFSEGRDRDADPSDSTLEASNFGLQRTTMGLSQSTRKAESRVPWQVYQNLKAIYGILLGGSTEIISQAQDWVEATIGLAVWWDGDDEEDMPVGSLAMTRRSLRKSNARNTRLVDVNPNAAYLRKLAEAFERVTDDSDDDLFQINSINPVEVGLASVFEGNVEGVIGLLRAWSLPIAAAIAEIAGTGGWFVRSGGVNLMGFSTDDLQLEGEPNMTMDSIIVDYAERLSAQESVQGRLKGTAYEGWELSIAVLKRLQDQKVAKELVGQLLDDMPVETDERIGKILDTCKRFKLEGEARRITETYADRVAENTDDYGTALVYYARARSQKRIKDVLDLLISLSLVDSIAFPPISDLDPNLHALIFTPEDSLAQLKEIDAKAAEILHTQLTGYAALRRFYDLRDEDVSPERGQKSGLRPMARKRAAAASLLAVINSAADDIHGGLYDPDRGSVVQVDGLMALLGEAMVFVNQPKGPLALPQCFALLKAVEDLQTVTPVIYRRCEEFFRSTLVAFQGRVAPASPRELLKKTMSSMTSAGSFSLVGSSMLESDSNVGMSGSRALVKPGEEERRGWDWRKGLDKDAKGEGVLRILRLGLAKDIAEHWVTSAGT